MPLGYDAITIAGLASAFAQAGVVLMIMLKTKNKKLKGVCGPAIISAMFGITEPAIYGVTLQFKRPFILACLASGIGGAIIGFGGVKQFVCFSSCNTPSSVLSNSKPADLTGFLRCPSQNTSAGSFPAWKYHMHLPPQ